MSNQDTVSRPNQPSAFARFLGFLVRLFIVVMLGIALGVAAYFGIPALYRQYIQPIEASLTQLEGAQKDQAAYNEFLNQRVEELSARIQDIELQNDTAKQTFSEIETRLETAEEALTESRTTINSALESATSSSEETLVGFQSTLEAIQKELTDVEEQLGALETNLNDTALQLDQLADDFISSQQQEDPSAALWVELDLLRAMELLTRSRIFLSENNLGIAREDVQLAHDLLVDVRERVPEYQVEALDIALERLETALDNLPDAPVLAADDLEVAWQVLRAGLPEEPVQLQDTGASESPDEVTTPTPYPAPTTSP